MSTIDYKQRRVVSNMHNAPRYGQTNNLASLASCWSSNESLAHQDYTKGIINFCVFLAILFGVWGLVLIVLKLNYGVDRVGCAAGGQIVETRVRISRAERKLRRAERKRRKLRGWRTQLVFLLASFLLPIFSLVLVTKGLDPFMASLESLVDVNYEVYYKAFQGIQIADSMTALYQELKDIPIVDVQSFCPNESANSLLASLGIITMSETFQSELGTVDSFVTDYLKDIRPGLMQVTDGTLLVNTGIDSVYDSNWILELFLGALNVVIGFFLFSFFLSKTSDAYSTFQAMLLHIMIPLFCLLLFGSIAATCAAATVALANADFCAGGTSPGSPLGTIQDMVGEYGYPEENLTTLVETGYPEGSLPYRSVAYYTQSCLPENPLAFIADFESYVGGISETVTTMVATFEAYGISELNEFCGTDVQPLNKTLLLLANTLDSLHDQARSATLLSDCSGSIEPIVRQLIGSTCTDSVDGLTWMFVSLLIIAILGMVILSTRAALFIDDSSIKRLCKSSQTAKVHPSITDSPYITHDCDESRRTIEPMPEGSVATETAQEQPVAIDYLDSESQDDASPQLYAQQSPSRTTPPNQLTQNIAEVCVFVD